MPLSKDAGRTQWSQRVEEDADGDMVVLGKGSEAAMACQIKKKN